jgi:hypothetical protein
MLPNDDEIEITTVGTIDDEGLRVLARLLIALDEAQQEDASNEAA